MNKTQYNKVRRYGERCIRKHSLIANLGIGLFVDTPIPDFTGPAARLKDFPDPFLLLIGLLLELSLRVPEEVQS